MKITNIIVLSIILFILLIICIRKSTINLKKDNFKNNDPALDGKMKFDYLYNKNYNEYILDKYYLNDDTRIDGVRVLYHPYQTKLNKLYGITNYIGLNRETSDKLYNDYGVRL